jgi:hypothetical protein
MASVQYECTGIVPLYTHVTAIVVPLSCKENGGASRGVWSPAVSRLSPILFMLISAATLLSALLKPS